MPACGRAGRTRSERKPVQGFREFKPTVRRLCVRLTAGKRKSMPFANEQEINAGEFFILNGVMVYVAEVNDPHIRNGKRNARLRLFLKMERKAKNLCGPWPPNYTRTQTEGGFPTTDTGPMFNPEPNQYSFDRRSGRPHHRLHLRSEKPFDLPEITRLRRQSVQDRLHGGQV